MFASARKPTHQGPSYPCLTHHSKGSCFTRRLSLALGRRLREDICQRAKRFAGHLAPSDLECCRFVRWPGASVARFPAEDALLHGTPALPPSRRPSLLLFVSGRPFAAVTTPILPRGWSTFKHPRPWPTAHRCNGRRRFGYSGTAACAGSPASNTLIGWWVESTATPGDSGRQVWTTAASRGPQGGW